MAGEGIRVCGGMSAEGIRVSCLRSWSVPGFCRTQCSSEHPTGESSRNDWDGFSDQPPRLIHLTGQ
jgi:hypothetical protein